MNQFAKKVYIVDDDESVRKSLSRLVKAVGFEAQTFGSAREFLSEPPIARGACLLLDICMPRMSGLELLEHLEESGSELPVIFVTAYDNEYRDIAEKSSAIACLHKPLQEGELLAVINKGLAKWKKSD